MTPAIRGLLAVSLLLAFLAVSASTYALASAPVEPGCKLGLRGLKRNRALATNPFFARFEPLMRWIAARIGPLIKGDFRAGLDRQVMLAGDYWGLTPDDYAALTILSAAGGFGLSLLLNVAFQKPAILVLFGGAIGALVPYFKLSGEAQGRMKRVQNGLPHVIDVVSLALGAGLDFPGALRQIVDKASDPNDPLIEEINLMLQELQIGKTRKQALSEFRTRVPGESVREFVNAVIQAEERGNPLAEVLRIQASSSRQRRSVRAEEQAAKAGLKILVPCVLVFAAIVILIVTPLLLKIQPLLSS